MEQLTELKTELASLRVQKIAGGSASKLTKMWVLGFRFEGSALEKGLESAVGDEKSCAG